MDNVRTKLRALKVLTGPFDPFEMEKAADDPHQQFLSWFEAAIAADVPEPHAMTLSTIGADGFPDARVLILKDVDRHGWYFAVSSKSPKGRQIAQRPAVSLTFYWQKLGRQVRIRGTAVDMGPEASAADFLARSEGSRIGALMERQSDILDDRAQLERALSGQRERVGRNPDRVASSWTVYAVNPTRVEFWQADANRRHARLCYRRNGQGWTSSLSDLTKSNSNLSYSGYFGLQIAHIRHKILHNSTKW